MKIIFGINKIRRFRRPVVALGVFDGVHLGHKRILKAAVDKARRIKGTSMVVTFWPDPHREKSIYSLEHRLILIGSVGIEICIVINFNKKFSMISGEDFIGNILVNKAGAQYIYVGRNFRFGKQAEGDYKALERLSRIYNFKLKLFDTVAANGRPISSTYIRKLITKGKLSCAGKLLTRPVSVLGTVISGTSLAAKLGFPTANINPHHEVLPPSGVYAARIIFKAKKFFGICYIGTKPTFRAQGAGRRAQGAQNIEVHIFNFKKNIYGEYLEIQFLEKIRNERKFPSLILLAKQIKRDILRSKEAPSLD